MELLAVMALIAILAALLLPVLARVRDAGRRTVCTSNLRQFGIAITAYADDYDGLYPVAPLTGEIDEEEEEDEDEEVDSGPLDWDEAILPYIPNEDGPVFRCPSDPSPLEFFELSYTLNASFAVGLSQAAISRPTETIVLADRRNSIENQAAAMVFLWWQWQDGAWPPRLLPDPTPAATRDLALDRHGDRLNFLFADGHVRALPFSTTWGAGPANQYWPQRP
jgi:general secretion pathway protein G